MWEVNKQINKQKGETRVKEIIIVDLLFEQCSCSSSNHNVKHKNIFCFDIVEKSEKDWLALQDRAWL